MIPVALQRSWLAALLALLAGALFPLALSPFDWWPCAIVSVLLLHWLVRHVSLRRGLVLFYLYGVGLYGVGVSWVYVSIRDHGGASAWLAGFLVLLFVLALALFLLLQGYLYLKFLRRSLLGPSLGFAAAWIVREWLLTWLFTGFPWLFAGYGFIDTWLAGYGPLLGVLGISYLVILQTCLLAMVGTALLRRRLPLAAGGVALAASIWLGGWLLSNTTFVQPTGEQLQVSAVQGNIDQDSKWRRAMVGPILQTYTNLSAGEWGRDLIVWPEAAITLFRSDAKSFLQGLSARGQATGTTVIMGIPDRDAEGNFLNSAIAVGQGEGTYVKRRLVPFGEYVPLESVLRGLIQLFDLPMSRNVSGADEQAPLLVGERRISMSICYEVVYPDLVRETVEQPDLLVTISNDTWFGASIGPWQHLQMARMRALENGRYMLRATNNGVTAVINQQGQVVASLPQFEQGVLRAEVPMLSGVTPFARFGQLAVLLLVLGSLAAVLLWPVILPNVSKAMIR
jgi:apolipoprotein N-acyltransferase